MSKWLQWMVLTSITGNPLVSILILLVFWWLADRYTLGLLPDPLRIVRRIQREMQLQRTLQMNPNDRKARLELADLLVMRGRHAKAVEVLKPNVAQGDQDVRTLFTLGSACLGAGHTEQGELFLAEAESQDPQFRMGEIHLVRGRDRLRRGDLQGALASFRALCDARPGTVEGKYLLAKVHNGLGDDVSAAYAKKNAWDDYAAAPRFQQRRDRFWAWRANPKRPLIYLCVALVAGALFSKFVGPQLLKAVQHSARPAYAAQQDDEP